MFGDYRHLCDKDPELQAEAEAAFQVLVDALRSLQGAGLVHRERAAEARDIIWAIVHGIAMLAITGNSGPSPPPREALSGLVDFALSACAPALPSMSRLLPYDTQAQRSLRRTALLQSDTRQRPASIGAAEDACREARAVAGLHSGATACAAAHDDSAWVTLTFVGHSTFIIQTSR